MTSFVKALKKTGENQQSGLAAKQRPVKKLHHTQIVEDIVLDQTRKIDIDTAALKKLRVFVDENDPASAEAISAHKDLRTSVLAKLDYLKAKTLMITSPEQGNGKSTTALNLAINIARLTQRTALLVDLDLRHPSIHRMIGYEPQFGVVDIATKDITIEEGLITPSIDRLSILTGKNRYRSSSEIIASLQMQDLIHEIKSRYRERVVIFDAPPLLGCDDVETLTPFMDACLVVVEENKTRYSQLDEVMGKLSGTNFLGYVLNKSKEKSFKRYYY